MLMLKDDNVSDADCDEKNGNVDDHNVRQMRNTAMSNVDAKG